MADAHEVLVPRCSAIALALVVVSRLTPFVAVLALVRSAFALALIPSDLTGVAVVHCIHLLSR